MHEFFKTQNAHLSCLLFIVGLFCIKQIVNRYWTLTNDVHGKVFRGKCSDALWNTSKTKMDWLSRGMGRR